MVASAPSPEATGGAGAGFEANVGAIVLARMLRGDRVPGVDLPPVRVGLQQRVAGAVLDDVVVEAEDPRGGVRAVEFQVKRTVIFVASDEDFIDIVTRCWRAIEQDERTFREGRRRDIASARSTHMADLQQVSRFARDHATLSGFETVVQGASRRGMRDRLEALRKVLRGVAADEEAAWRVAQALYVWPVDAEPDGSDVLAAQDRLVDLVLVDRDADAAAVFENLTGASRVWAIGAGSVDLGMLRMHLEEAGFALDAAPARRAAFDALRLASSSLLGRSAAQLGRRLHLPRHAQPATIGHCGCSSNSRGSASRCHGPPGWCCR